MPVPWNRSGAIAEPLINLADKGNLEKDPLIQQLIVSASITGNEVLTRDLVRILQVRATTELLKDFPFKPPEAQKLIGGLGPENAMLLGRIREETIPFLYPHARMVEHALVTGASGTGKTNLLYSMILQSLPRSAAWVFDQKQDFRHLLRFGVDLAVFHVREKFLFNIFQPPTGVVPEDWYPAVISIICKSFGFLGASGSLLYRAVAKNLRSGGSITAIRTIPHWQTSCTGSHPIVFMPPAEVDVRRKP